MDKKANYISATRRRRDGISIIEVLTSLAVATIGVFGVLVLIPFAVRQAQLGLDQDAADLVGRNAIEDLQTYGYTTVSDSGQLALRGSKILVTARDVRETLDDRSDDVVTVVPLNSPQILGAIQPDRAPNFYPTMNLERNSGLNARFPRVIHFDPVAVAAVGFPTGAGEDNPDFLTGQLPPSGVGEDGQRNDLRVTVATGICLGANNRFTTSMRVDGQDVFFNLLLDPAEVNRIFRSEDDLIVGERNFLLPQTNDDAVALNDLSLPQPVFDVSGGGNLMKRQSAGRISWSALYVPVKDSNRVKTAFGAPPTEVRKYKVYILVYKDRSVIPGDPESVNRSAVVNRRNSDALDNDASATTNGGFVQAVNQIYLRSESSGVFKDDWVMLINRRPAPDYSATEVGNLGLSSPVGGGERLDAEEAGYDVQVGFAKVLGVRSLAGPDDSETRSILTVDGGPFDFYFNDIQGAAFGSNPAFTTETHLIHLNNVINVYERTITLERNSVWN